MAWLYVYQLSHWKLNILPLHKYMRKGQNMESWASFKEANRSSYAGGRTEARGGKEVAPASHFVAWMGEESLPPWQSQCWRSQRSLRAGPLMGGSKVRLSWQTFLCSSHHQVSKVCFLWYLVTIRSMNMFDQLPHSIVCFQKTCRYFPQIQFTFIGRMAYTSSSLLWTFTWPAQPTIMMW